MNWCILIPLLVGAICAILGYLLGRLFGGNDEECQGEVATLKAELDACKGRELALTSSMSTLETDLESVKASLATSFSAASVALVSFDAAAAKAVFGKKVKENDLTLVEGIGPKIQELFHNHGVNTWKALSECSIEKCQTVLNSGGDRFKIHKPGTWPKQAELAYQGKWEALLKWQDELDGGK